MANNAASALDRRFNLLEKKATQQARGQTQQQQEALKRRFAAMGGGGSGSAIKQEQLAAERGAQRETAAREGVEFARLGEMQRRAEATEGREFARGERLGSQEFASGEALKGRQYGTSERLGSQEFSAGQSAIGRRFATSERLGTQRFATGERKAGQTFASEEAQKGRTFASSEAEKNRSVTEKGLFGYTDPDGNRVPGSMELALKASNREDTAQIANTKLQVGTAILEGIPGFSYDDLGALGVPKDKIEEMKQRAGVSSQQVKNFAGAPGNMTGKMGAGNVVQETLGTIGRGTSVGRSGVSVGGTKIASW